MTTAATSDITIAARNGRSQIRPAARAIGGARRTDRVAQMAAPKTATCRTSAPPTLHGSCVIQDCGEKPSCQRPTHADQGAIVLGQSSVHSREDRGAGESRQARARAGLQKGWTVIHGHEDQGGPG